MILLSTVILNSMMNEYKNALKSSYQSMANSLTDSVENVLASYNEITKASYSYGNDAGSAGNADIQAFDNLRKIINGYGYLPENKKLQQKMDIEEFLKGLQSVDSYIVSASLLAEDEGGQQLAFHYSTSSKGTVREGLFQKEMGYKSWDKTNRKLILLPTHGTEYYSSEETVFTVARNYLDLRHEVGNMPYVATVFLDIRLSRLELLFRNKGIQEGDYYFLTDEENNCFYSNVGKAIGSNLKEISLPEKEYLSFESSPNDFGLKVSVYMNSARAYEDVGRMRTAMYLFIGICIFLLIIASFSFSYRLTRPIHNMMKKMEQVEEGNFDVQVPVNSRDEIGMLSQRFNEMSAQLKKYINQSFAAQIKQKEAELTALKSQIYPHFLYNTLEIIRMSAMENGDQSVSDMIEALSMQIHYLLGPAQDMVPLKMEIEIVQKYVYLLNCRIDRQITLSVSVEQETGNLMVPKLILQPIVENAYVHGIKPKNGSGSIMIEGEQSEDGLVISVLDNGVGMDSDQQQRLQKLLDGDEIGVKNEYNWQSIGMKNVHDRIRFLYGNEYGVQVTSTSYVGTIVRLLLPVIKEEEKEHVKDDYCG